MEGLKWFPAWWAMLSKPQAWIEPRLQGGGKNLVPNIPVTCVLTKCLLLEIESLVGFPLVSRWAWEQIQYQESDYEIIIHCSLLGRKFRAVSLHGATVEEGSQEKRLRGSLHVVSPCAPCLGGRGKATETSPLVQGLGHHGRSPYLKVLPLTLVVKSFSTIVCLLILWGSFTCAEILFSQPQPQWLKNCDLKQTSQRILTGSFHPSSVKYSKHTYRWKRARVLYLKVGEFWSR